MRLEALPIVGRNNGRIRVARLKETQPSGDIGPGNNTAGKYGRSFPTDSRTPMKQLEDWKPTKDIYVFKPPAASGYFLWDRTPVGPSQILATVQSPFNSIEITHAAENALSTFIMKSKILKNTIAPSKFGILLGRIQEEDENVDCFQEEQSILDLNRDKILLFDRCSIQKAKSANIPGLQQGDYTAAVLTSMGDSSQAYRDELVDLKNNLNEFKGVLEHQYPLCCDVQDSKDTLQIICTIVIT
jgi:hypothetical protein